MMATVGTRHPTAVARRNRRTGNTSLYFGFQNPNDQPGNWGGVNDPGIRNSYDFPGRSARNDHDQYLQPA